MQVQLQPADNDQDASSNNSASSVLATARQVTSRLRLRLISQLTLHSKPTNTGIRYPVYCSCIKLLLVKAPYSDAPQE